MNQLISHPSKTMSSRELLTIINVCRAEFDESHVRLNDFNNRVVDELDGYHYESFVVNNPNGTQSTEHRLTIDQCILVGMRESKAVRRKVLEKLTDMKSQQTVPQVQVVGKAEDATRAALLLSQHLNIKGPALETFLVTTVENIIGVEIPYRPLIEQRTYSAAEIGDVLGISANKVGRIANAHGLKTDEFGMLYLSKSQHSDKQVEHFRYFEKAIDRFKSILETE